MNVLEKLSFGQDSAESEIQSLHYVFLSVPFYQRLKTMKKWLVVGRKGSGKTAACLMFFRQLETEHKVTLMTPKSLSAAKSALLDKASINSDEAALMKWKYVFLVEMSRYVCHAAQEQFGENYTAWGEPLRKIRSFLIKYESTEANTLDNAMKFIRSINKFAISVFKVEGAIEVEKISESASALSDDLDIFFSILKEANKYIGDKPLYILVDQVDDLWDSTEEGQNLIIGLLRAAKEINDSISLLRIVVFLRADIFSYLRFHDSDKYRSNMEKITWDTENLKKLIALRIRKSTGIKGDVNSLWDSIFPSKINSVDSFKYIVNQTLMRPRDLIQLCNICTDKARNRNSDTITIQDIDNAISQYSTWKLEDLVSEYAVQYPFLERLILSLFYTFPSYQLSRQQFEELFDAQKEYFIEEYSSEYFEPIDVLLQILYTVGFLGVIHNGNILYEALDDKFILPYAMQLEIHSAFRKGLSIPNQAKSSSESKVTFDQRSQNVSNQININVGGNVDSNVIIGNRYVDLIQDNFNTINRSIIQSELKELVKQLNTAVIDIIQILPRDLAEETADDMNRLVKEIVKAKPNSKWYNVSIEGLIYTAQNVGKTGEPVIELAGKIRRKLTGGLP